MNILICGEQSTLDHLPPREIGGGEEEDREAVVSSLFQK